MYSQNTFYIARYVAICWVRRSGGWASVASLCITMLAYISTTSNEQGKLTAKLVFQQKFFKV